MSVSLVLSDAHAYGVGTCLWISQKGRLSYLSSDAPMYLQTHARACTVQAQYMATDFCKSLARNLPTVYTLY